MEVHAQTGQNNTSLHNQAVKALVIIFATKLANRELEPCYLLSAPSLNDFSEDLQISLGELPFCSIWKTHLPFFFYNC